MTSSSIRPLESAHRLILARRQPVPDPAPPWAKRGILQQRPRKSQTAVHIKPRGLRRRGEDRSEVGPRPHRHSGAERFSAAVNHDIADVHVRKTTPLHLKVKIAGLPAFGPEEWTRFESHPAASGVRQDGSCRQSSPTLPTRFPRVRQRPPQTDTVRLTSPRETPMRTRQGRWIFQKHTLGIGSLTSAAQSSLKPHRRRTATFPVWRAAPRS